MTVLIKNADSVPHTWVGQTINPGVYYTVQPFELIRWQNNSVLLTAIGDGLAVVNNGSSDILDVNTAVNYLKNLSVPYAADTGGFPPAQAVLMGGVNGSGDIEGVNVDPSNNLEVVGVGTAGTPVGGVVSVQGVAGGTNVPVSVSSSALPSGAATAANQTNGTQLAQTVDASGHVQPVGDIPSRAPYVTPTDGTHAITIKASSTAAVGTDTSEVVALSPNTPLPAGANALGSVIGNQGSPNTLGNAWPVEPTDGTNKITVKPASTAAAVGDTAEVVALSPNTPLPSGANSIGQVTAVQSSGSNLHVDVDNFPGTQTVNGTITVVQGAGSNLHVDVDNFPATTTVVQTTGANLHVDVDNFPATQPISAVSLPLPTGASTSAHQTDGTQLSQTVDASGHVQPAGDTVARAIFVEPTDGTHSITIKAASTAAVATDTSEVVALSPNTPLPAGTNALGTVTAVQSSGANLHVDVDNFPATQPISAVSLPLPTGAATSALQTTGNTSLNSIDTKTPALGQAAMASSSPVVVASDQSNLPVLASADSSTSGTLGALNATVVLSSMHGLSSVLFQLTGTWVGTVLAEASIDGTDWTTVNTAPIPGGTLVSTGATANGLYRGASVAAYTSYRLRMSAYTSGTATVTINSSQAVAFAQAFQTNAVNLNAQVVGDSASGSADSGGNPVKVGGVFTSAPTALTTGQRANLNLDSFGNISIGNNTAFTHITANGTTTIKSGATLLYSIIVNNLVGGATLTVYNNTAGSGAVVAVINSVLNGASQAWTPSTMNYGGVLLGTGLTVVAAGGPSDYTIIYK